MVKAGLLVTHAREMLRGDGTCAMKSLQSTERSLRKHLIARKVYSEQIQDMVNRGAARKVSREEMEQWTGVVNYIPHLAVSNPKSQSTPVCIVFDASRPQGGRPALNSILAKGPDRYLNNQATVILRFKMGGLLHKAMSAKCLTPFISRKKTHVFRCFFGERKRLWSQRLIWY